MVITVAISDEAYEALLALRAQEHVTAEEVVDRAIKEYDARYYVHKSSIFKDADDICL